VTNDKQNVLGGLNMQYKKIFNFVLRTEY